MRVIFILFILCSCFKNEPVVEEPQDTLEEELSRFSSVYPPDFFNFENMMERVSIEHQKLLGRSMEYTFIGAHGDWSPEMNTDSYDGAELRLRIEGNRYIIALTAWGNPEQKRCMSESVYEQLPPVKGVPTMGNTHYCLKDCWNTFKQHMATGKIEDSGLYCSRPIDESSVVGATIEAVQTDVGVDIITTLLDENREPDVKQIDSYRRD